MSSEPSRNKIEVLENGPFYVEGEIQFLDPQEQVVKTEPKAFLCRCGQSKDKPFCDGSHKECGFEHVANTLEGKYGTAAEVEVAVSIEPLANGPLFVTGAFCLISSDGETVCEGNKTVLCRCGKSENKPFCDGSHKDHGFEAPVMGA